MVVTRRTPVPPAPTSRTPSTQPVPRVPKKTDASNALVKPSPLVNGNIHDSNLKSDHVAGVPHKSSPLKGKQKSKKHAKKRSKGGTFGELLFRGFLLWFTIYTLSVCPQDEHLKSPICRGLSEYRRLVIEPYFIPPIQQAISHPSVAPYIEKAKPYADYAVRIVTPIAARAQKEFDVRVVPQWNKRIVPLYHKHAVPQLAKFYARMKPYQIRAEHEFEHHLAPYVRRASSTLYRWQVRARPYVVLAAEKSYRGYQVAHPYAQPLWKKVKAALSHVAAFIGDQRRQFVDPHVKKIWEHAKELSNGNSQTSAASQLRSSTTPRLSQASSHLSGTSASSVISKPVDISSSVATPDTSSGVTLQATSSLDLPSSPSPTEAVGSSAPTGESTGSSTSSSIVSTGSDVTPNPDAQATSEDAQLPVSMTTATSASAEQSTASNQDVEGNGSLPVVGNTSPLSDNQVEVTSATVAQPSALVSDATEAHPSASSSLVAELATPSSSDPDSLDLLSDPDLEAFKAELGLTDDLILELEADPEVSVPVEPQVSEEERLRLRKEKAARDRAEIDRRHTAWEAQLAQQIEENKKVVRQTLTALRKAAAVELKDKREIRDEIDDLVHDAEKFLRGAEKYLSNLQKERRTMDEKKTLWDRVISKLEDKFSDRLGATESLVNSWYMGKIQEEINEVKRLAQEVRNIADSGQADLGLDYAYLDDVTYLDWQRYHDLVRNADRFYTHAASVQNGSDSSPLPNPVLPMIHELEAEVDDVIAGFNARLRNVKRDGARAFGSAEDQSTDEEDTEQSASILPIEQPKESESPVSIGVPPIVIGRSKDEVEAALNRVADLEGDKTSPLDEPEKLQDADAVARSLEDAVASEQVSGSSPLHAEL